MLLNPTFSLGAKVSASDDGRHSREVDTDRPLVIRATELRSLTVADPIDCAIRQPAQKSPAIRIVPARRAEICHHRVINARFNEVQLYLRQRRQHAAPEIAHKPLRDSPDGFVVPSQNPRVQFFDRHGQDQPQPRHLVTAEAAPEQA